MPVKKIISAAAKAAAKKAGKKSKVLSSKQMAKRLDDKVKAKKFGQSLTEFRRSEKLLDKMSKLSPSSSQYKKLQDKFMQVKPSSYMGKGKRKVKPKKPIVMSEEAAKRSGRNLKPIPGTRRPKKQFGGTVYNSRGMKVPGMVQDGGALRQASLGGSIKALAKKAGKFFSKKKKKTNKFMIDGKDLRKLRFKGTSRSGESIVKQGLKGKENISYVAGNVKAKKKIQNKIWKEDLYKNMYKRF